MNSRAKKAAVADKIQVPAIRTTQGGVHVYAFFAPGAVISEVADISRIARDDKGELEGFQRREIKKHVKAITDYLKHGDVLFPNAIILAFSEEPKFSMTRGARKDGATLSGDPGYVELPRREAGSRIAWIVDGQQRSLAMQECGSQFPVPVVGFVSNETKVHREQFILVNKARPLPQRLIAELLPATNSMLLPRDLEAKRVPSQLCDALNRDPKSPFHQFIKRPSGQEMTGAIVTDSSVTTMIQQSMEDPRGALAQLKDLGNNTAKSDEMYELLCAYWSAVKTVFPKDWGLKPERSRLMHSVGIISMGALMDRIVLGQPKRKTRADFFVTELRRIATECAWTSGTWPIIGRSWDSLQNTNKDIRDLQHTLVQMYTRSVAR